MDREKSIYEEAAEKSNVKPTNYLIRENPDWDRCDWCQYRFKSLEEQEKICKECIFYLLQED